MDAKKTIVLDNGGHTIKIGFANEKEPQLLIPNCIGRVRRGNKNKVVGEAVAELHDYTIFRYLKIKLKRQTMLQNQ